MAAVTFQYRSKKKKAFLEVRLSFRIKGENLNTKADSKTYGKEMPYIFYTRSKIEVSKDFWIEYAKGTNFQNVDKVNLKKDLDADILKLKEYLQKKIENVDVSQINKDWLKKIVGEHYNPPVKEEKIPSDLLGFFNYYLETNRATIQQKDNTWRNWLVVKGKLERFLNGDKYKIEDVDVKFKNKWQNYFLDEGYAKSTIKKDFKYIRQICIKAREEGIKAFPTIDKIDVTLKDESKDLPVIYLTIQDLKKIKDLKNLPSYLDNVRDWLIISCFTGQRISDFMRFNKSMLQSKNGKMFLDIKQVKTDKEVSIPIMPEVLNILEKRNGEFPNQISEQKYNKYIKEVAKRAGIDEMVKGGIKIDNRRVIDNYPKWRLISSHTGRRAFASNYYKILDTVTLKRITGHKREETFLSYIGESTDKADEVDYDKMMKAGLNI